MKKQYLVSFLALSVMLGLLASAHAQTIQYSDRASFLNAVQQSITDDYSAYPSSSESSVRLTNVEMSAVLGETRYESLSFTDLNLVGDVYIYGDKTNYCAGCNGNFQLIFDNTSLSRHGGVFGVGLDILLHTARRNAIGDVVPGDTVADGGIRIELTDGTVKLLTIPADIGFFGPETYFLGLTDSRGIRSLTIGVEPFAERHRWVIDNLTITAPARVPDCSAALPFPTVLWSPKHQFVPVVVMGVTDPDGDAVKITVTGVTQDEPVNAKGDGNTSPDAVIEAGAASVRAERSGKDNGRVYQVSFKAENSKGGSCTGAVTIGVPHSLGKGLTAIDDGQVYDSTVP